MATVLPDTGMETVHSKPLVVQLEQTCEVAPAQWEGRTKDDRPVYIRWRGCVLEVRLGQTGDCIMDAIRGETIFKKRLPNELDEDLLITEEMIEVVRDVLDFLPGATRMSGATMLSSE